MDLPKSRASAAVSDKARYRTRYGCSSAGPTRTPPYREVERWHLLGPARLFNVSKSIILQTRHMPHNPEIIALSTALQARALEAKRGEIEPLRVFGVWNN